MPAKKFTFADAPLEPQRGDDPGILIGDVLGKQDDGPMSVGFCRYAPHQSMDYTVTYDEVLIITKGRFFIQVGDTELSAGPGEALYLDRDTTLTYASREEGAEMIYVTYPKWRG